MRRSRIACNEQEKWLLKRGYKVYHGHELRTVRDFLSDVAGRAMTGTVINFLGLRGIDAVYVSQDIEVTTVLACRRRRKIFESLECNKSTDAKLNNSNGTFMATLHIISIR